MDTLPLIDDAKKKVVTKLLQAYYHDILMDDPVTFLRDDTDPAFIQYILDNRELQFGCALVTVNPKEGTTYQDLNKKVLKAMRKSMILKYLYCYEWREGKKGLHVHMIVTLTMKKKRSHIQREFYSTFKSLVGNSLSVNIQTTNCIANMRKYVQGLKQGVEKKNFINDRKNRAEMGIADYVQDGIEHSLDEEASPTCKASSSELLANACEKILEKT